MREVGSILGSGTSSIGGHGNSLQYSCLENPMGRGAWRAIVDRVAKSQIQLKWLSTYTHMYHLKDIPDLNTHTYWKCRDGKVLWNFHINNGSKRIEQQFDQIFDKKRRGVEGQGIANLLALVSPTEVLRCHCFISIEYNSEIYDLLINTQDLVQGP